VVVVVVALNLKVLALVVLVSLLSSTLQLGL
jgi:hypothetical protein